MEAGDKRIARNTIYLYIRLLIVMIVSLYTVRVVMHELGIEGFGIFNVVAGFVTMLGFIGTTMTTGIQRFYNYEIGEKGETSAVGVYSASLKIQIGCALLILIGFETIGLWYVNNVMILPRDRMMEINLLYQFALGSLLLNILVIPYSAFTISKEHMDLYALLSIVEASGKLGVAFLLSNFSNKLSVYGFLLFVLSIINFTGYYIFCKRKYPWLNYKEDLVGENVRNIISFSGWNALSAFANMGKTQGVNLLLNYFFGVIINAANAIVTPVYSAVQLFSINISTAFRPQLTESYAKKDFRRTKFMLFTMSKAAYVMVLTICIPLYLELDYILHIWLGNDIPLFTHEFIGVTLLIVLVGSLNTPVSQVIFANGKIRNFALTYSAISLCVPLGWLFFSMGYPAITVFWITLLLMILIQVASLFLLKKVLPYKIRDYMAEVLLPLLLFSVIVPVIPVLVRGLDPDSGIARLILIIVVTVIFSVITSYGLLLGREQREWILDRLRKTVSIHNK